jgi:hypothetical protein
VRAILLEGTATLDGDRLPTKSLPPLGPDWCRQQSPDMTSAIATAILILRVALTAYALISISRFLLPSWHVPFFNDR